MSADPSRFAVFRRHEGSGGYFVLDCCSAQIVGSVFRDGHGWSVEYRSVQKGYAQACGGFGLRRDALAWLAIHPEPGIEVRI